jgi:hypothetical protein
VTSPANIPVKLVALPAVVATAALPLRFAVIVPAMKLPDASRRTIAFGVLLFVAPLAALTPAATFAAVTPPTDVTVVAPWVPAMSPEKVPVKLVALLAVVALPSRVAVMIPALKLPDPSRRTNLPGVFASVAALAAPAPAAMLAAGWPAICETTVALCVPVTSPEKFPLNEPGSP